MKKNGFTLAELLIALAILGVIAVFTIPKVLQSQQDTKFKSIGKEAASALSQAYQLYRQDNGAPPTTMVSSALIPYLNYIRQDTTTVIDSSHTQGTASCALNPCVAMHNGSMILFWPGSFAGTGSNNFVWALVDPDGQVTGGGNNGPGKSLILVLYYNGRLATRGTMVDPSINSNSTTWAPAPTYDPPWFGWD